MFKTYIAHYSKLKERKDLMLKQLDGQNITDYEFVESYDQEDLNEEIISQYYADNEELSDNYARTSLRKLKLEYSHEKLSLASISLCIKHVKMLSSFLETKSDYALMLEDDCRFMCDPRDASIENIILNAPKDWDVIFVGGAFVFEDVISIKHMNGQYALADHPTTNTTSSMIFNRNSAKKTLDTILPFCLPIDWQLNHVFYMNDFNVYHTRPYICEQLSNVLFEGTVKRK